MAFEAIAKGFERMDFAFGKDRSSSSLLAKASFERHRRRREVRSESGRGPLDRRNTAQGKAKDSSAK